MMQLENSFMNPIDEGTPIPPISSKQEDTHSLEIVNIFGTAAWFAHFSNMFITNSCGNYMFIRRLSTPSSVIADTKFATFYRWYFRDEKNNWECFDSNRVFSSIIIPNINSNEIDVEYCMGRVDMQWYCENNSNRYMINFKKMTLVNKTTLVERSVRRRPAVKMGYNKVPNVDHDLPFHWCKMDQTAISQQFILSSSDNEYVMISELVKSSFPRCNIIDIVRNQTPHLWKVYTNRKEFIKKKNKVNSVQEKYLFHGTDPKNITDICNENIDWRLHGRSRGEIYGEGAYFTNS